MGRLNRRRDLYVATYADKFIAMTGYLNLKLKPQICSYN